MRLKAQIVLLTHQFLELKTPRDNPVYVSSEHQITLMQIGRSSQYAKTFERMLPVVFLADRLRHD